MRLTGAAATRRHLEHIAYGDAAEDRPIRSLEGVVGEVPTRGSPPGHVYVIGDHHGHANGAYRQRNRQCHLPCFPRRWSTCRGYWAAFGNTSLNYYIRTRRLRPLANPNNEPL
jgi:hypothetical protein